MGKMQTQLILIFSRGFLIRELVFLNSSLFLQLLALRKCLGPVFESDQRSDTVIQSLVGDMDSSHRSSTSGSTSSGGDGNNYNHDSKEAPLSLILRLSQRLSESVVEVTLKLKRASSDGAKLAQEVNSHLLLFCP